MALPVLFIIQHLDHGGTEFHFQELLTGLDRARIAPHVMYSTPGVASRALEALGTIPVTRIPVRRAYDATGLRAALKIRRHIREHNIKAVVAFHFVADFLSVAATMGMRGAPPIVSSRRDMGFTRTSRQIRIGRWMQPRIACYIAVAEAVRQAVARDEHVPLGKISVVYNGLDLAALDAIAFDLGEERRRRNLAPADLVIGCIANFNPVKQHLTLLEAFDRLRRARPELPLKLMLTGDGPMRGAIEEKIKALNLGDSVRLPGRSPQFSADYSVSDIYVLPSETEGFSNAIVQAMLRRRPVVACRVGGNPEAIEDGVSGLLVEPKDPAALADALMQLVDSPALRARFSAAARRRAEQRFTLQAMLENIQRIIEQAAVR